MLGSVTRDHHPEPPAHTIMFWLLTGMAMLVFATCVLLPVWNQTERILEREHRIAEGVSLLRMQVERNQERIDALKNDPQVVGRLARRQLNHRPHEDAVVVYATAHHAPVRVTSWLEDPADLELPLDPRPDWLLASIRWLPDWPWQSLFVRSPNRELMLGLSAGLMLSACWLYWPRRARPGTRFHA